MLRDERCTKILCNSLCSKVGVTTTLPHLGQADDLFPLDDLDLRGRADRFLICMICMIYLMFCRVGVVSSA